MIKAILLKIICMNISHVLCNVDTDTRLSMMSYLAAVEVAIVVTVLLTKQAVRLLKKKNCILSVSFLQLLRVLCFHVKRV